MKKNNWLVLSHAFNMDGRAASQTITDKIPFLIKNKINIQVLSSITGLKDKNINHRQLLPWSASGLIFDLRFWLKMRIGKRVVNKLFILILLLLLLPIVLFEKILIRLPSSSGWAIPAAIIGIYRVKKQKVNLIFSTGGAWSAHLAGYWIWKFTKTPWIVEFHDPLYSIYDENSKKREINLLKWLEKKIINHATLVWWFTEGAEKRVRLKYEVGSKGFNELAGANPKVSSLKYIKKTKIIFSHFGSLVPGRSLSLFLFGLKELIKSSEIDVSLIEVHIYGGNLDRESEEIIQKYNLEKLIIQHGRIEASQIKSGRSIIMDRMLQSDVLLLMHGEDKNCSEYIPSKFYEYLYSKRAILAYPYANQQFSQLLSNTNCYSANRKNSSEVILQIINDWNNDNLRVTGKFISTEVLVNRILEKLKDVENHSFL